MKNKAITFVVMIIFNISLGSIESLSKKNILDTDLTTGYERGTFLIVLANPDFYDRLEYSAIGYNFIDFKKTQGFDVEVISFREGNENVSGINAETSQDLKNYLMNYYDSNPMLEYVLLVGDVNQSLENYNIPTFTIASYNPPIVNDQTDYPYTIWGDDASDIYQPKFFVGRWSISEEQDITKLIMRNINYYTLKFGPNDIDASYLNNALMVAGNYNGNSEQPSTWPVTPVWTTKWLMEELYHYGYSQIDTALFHTGNYETGEINPQIENSFNEGIGIVNYRGWGDATGWHKPKFHLDDIGELNGNDKLPIVFSFVCNTADFGNETQSFCFGEELITAGSVFNQKGAVAVVGPSDLDTDTRFNNVICGAMWDGLLEHKVNELAPALHYGKMAVLNEFEGLVVGENPTNIPLFYHHVYVVLGDPSISVWLSEPDNMSSEFDTFNEIGHSYISSIITDELGVPLMDVVGVVIKDNEIVSKGLSNSDGYLDINLNDLQLGDSFELYLNKSGFRQKQYSLEFNVDDETEFPTHFYTIPNNVEDYGYVFIDSNSNHELAPVYNWIEINQLGTNLNLTDDSHTIVPIGFDFAFYGEDFNELTVGSNGWASFLSCLNGDEQSPDCEVINHFFNNSITFPIGPYGLLAPFYDDLDDNVGTEPFNIFSYADTENHRFIVQWDDLANGENDDLCPNNCDKETFQLILYDPDYYTTQTGDGIIIFQYKEIHDVDDHGSTVGIESLDKNEGIQYLFNYSYHPGASTLSDGLAIKFLVTDEVLDNNNVNIPSAFTINSVYPNPFNPSTNVNIDLELTANIELSIIDVNGRLIDNLYSGTLSAGNHDIVWNPNGKVASGVYLVKLDVLNEGISIVKEITLLK